MKTITIELADSTYDALRDAAHRRGSTVTQVVTGAAVAVARAYSRPTAALVYELHAEGLPVQQIAGELGIVVKRVREELARLHLSPNPRPPAPKPVNPRARKARP